MDPSEQVSLSNPVVVEALKKFAQMSSPAEREAARDALEPTPGAIFARQLARTRQAKGMKQRDVIRRLDALGRPMDPATLTRIEKGTRGVSLDDAFALASALDVPPLDLIAPGTRGARVQVAPKDVRTATAFRRWVKGEA